MYGSKIARIQVSEANRTLWTRVKEHEDNYVNTSLQDCQVQGMPRSFLRISGGGSKRGWGKGIFLSIFCFHHYFQVLQSVGTNLSGALWRPAHLEGDYYISSQKAVNMKNRNTTPTNIFLEGWQQTVKCMCDLKTTFCQMPL